MKWELSLLEESGLWDEIEVFKVMVAVSPGTGRQAALVLPPWAPIHQQVVVLARSFTLSSESGRRIAPIPARPEQAVAQ